MKIRDRGKKRNIKMTEKGEAAAKPTPVRTNINHNSEDTDTMQTKRERKTRHDHQPDKECHDTNTE